MGLFTEEKKVHIPSSVGTARGQMEQFIMDRPLGADPGIPTRDIAGLTPLQREFMRMAGGQVTGRDYGILADVFRQAAQREIDVATSPQFEGYRRMIEDMKTQQRTGIRQRGELGGQLVSTPTAALESENVRQFDTALMQEFARLQQEAQDRKLRAAAGLAELGTRRLGDIAAASQIAEQERSIEQARNDAVYNQAIATILFPYQEQLQLLSTLAGQPIVTTRGGGLTDLGFIANVGAQAAGAYFGAKG